MSLHANVASRKCRFTQMSLHANVASRKCCFTQMSLHANVASCKCRFMQILLHANVASRKCRSTQMSLHANVASRKCRFTQMSLYPCGRIQTLGLRIMRQAYYLCATTYNAFITLVYKLHEIFLSLHAVCCHCTYSTTWMSEPSRIIWAVFASASAECHMRDHSIDI